MPTRERWIVYPLLFLALGIALRDKIVPPAHLQVGELVCNRLESDRAECGMLLIPGPNGRPAVMAGTDVNNRAGIVETFNDNGKSQVRLFSTENGGKVTTLGRSGRIMLIMGDMGHSFGLFADLPGLGQIIPLTLPGRFGGKPVMIQPSK